MHLARRVLTLSALATLLTVVVPTAGAQTPAVTAVIGSADGLFSELDVQVIASTSNLDLDPTPSVVLPPDGGSVSDGAGPIVLSGGTGGVTVRLRAATAAVSADGAIGPAGFVTAATTVADFALEIVGTGTEALVSGDAVSATCSADLGGVSASTSLVGVTILGEAIETDPAPNTPVLVTLDGSTISGTLNQQVENPDGSLSVSPLVLDVDVSTVVDPDVAVTVDGTLRIGPATCGVVAGVADALLVEPNFTG
jgi:hypothetical protein